MKLDGTQTHTNLKAAFEAESTASVVYRWCAQQADVEGHPDAAKQFVALAEIKLGQAFGHLDYLAEVGHPTTGAPIGDTADNLAAASSTEADKANDLLAGFAEVARAEGLDEIAEWLDTQVRSDLGHAQKFDASLENL